MKFRYIIVCLCLLMAISASAQEVPDVSFYQPVADLGTIIDNHGVVDHRFTFVNKSSKPVTVDKVNTSCGCTSTDWTADSIAAEAEGFVEVQFDPTNRPGPFEKQALVYFKGHRDSTVLVIKGFVKPASVSIEEEFPLKMGALRVKGDFLDLGTVKGRSLFSRSFPVYNESNQILVFSDDMAGPNHITVTYEPYTLKPRSTGKMWIHYDVGAKNDLGYFREDISIFTYESSGTRKDFTVTATLLDIPSSVTAESPRVHFDQTEIDFGIKEQGDTVNVVFPVRNLGKTTLRLKKIFGNCNCIKTKPNSYRIEPGESADISVGFTTDERIGNQEKTVTVFTDDPLMPVAILKLKGRLRDPRN